MFRKISISRRARNEDVTSTKKNKKIRSIFRKKSNKSRVQSKLQEPSLLEPNLTFTLSEESQFENDLGISTTTYETSSTASPSAEEVALTGTNFEVDVETSIDLEVFEEAVEEAVEEVIKEVVSTISPKAEKISTFIFTEQELMDNELKHMRELAEKQQEIDKMQLVLGEMQDNLAEKEKDLAETKADLITAENELNEAYQECDDLDNKVRETKIEVMTKTEELQIVTSTLMQCQTDLHEVAAQDGILSITSAFWSMLN